MKIALFQTKLIWHKPEENRILIQEYIESCEETYDLLVLPEMFTSGFTMYPHGVAEKMNDKTMNWLKQLAFEKKIAITGSFVVEENGAYYNRLVFVFPNGDYKFYNKRHLFTLAGEEKVYVKGSTRTIVDYKGWKICPLICYDLRFPVYSRNTDNYELLLYVANWPKPRIQAWDVLLKARAIENMSYTIGVNRIGFDQNDLEYTGSSQVVDFLGNELLNCKDEQGLFIVEINKEEMLNSRKKLNFLNDKDIFEIIN